MDMGGFWVSGHQACAHRFVYELIVGPIPAGWTVDHRDTCPRRCVNPDHLRAATYKQQNENRPGAQGRSGVRGVYWGKDRDKWRVLVIHNRKKYAGGDFDDLADANVAAVALRNRLFTHNDADRQSS